MKEREPIIIEFNMIKLAKINFWMTILLGILFVAFNSIIHKRTGFEITLWDFLIFWVSYFVLTILHELSHLIGFMVFGKVRWSQLDYGVNLKLGVAYATTSIPISNHAMKKVLMLPFWTTGFVPSLIGFIIDNQLLVLLGAFLIGGAVGDFYMCKELRKFPNNALVKDDPNLPRLYVYEQNL